MDRVNNAQIYTDFSALGALRAQAREDESAALDTVANQFESLFVQMMLKSMRDASFGGGLFDSGKTEFYQDMYDKQISVSLTEKSSIGLADMIKHQIGGASANTMVGRDIAYYQGNAVITIDPATDNLKLRSDALTEDKTNLGKSPEDFLKALWPIAKDAADSLKIKPEALLAQAALESGWGKHVMRHNNGDSSHNLFGIKSDSRWDGDKVNVSTLEYKEGVAVKTQAKFRAYESFQDSFSDYVSFIQSNPRYADALKVSDDSKSYLGELQKAGYATDPKYAEKISRILDGDAMRNMREQQKEAEAI